MKLTVKMQLIIVVFLWFVPLLAQIPLEPDPYWVFDIGQVRMVGLGDVNADGYLDMALSLENESNQIFINQNGILPSAPTWYSSDLAPSYGLAFGDYNNDGYNDLAVANFYLGGGSVTLYENENGVMNPIPVWMGSVGAMDVSWGDVDCDGDLDLAAVDIFQYPCVFYNNNGSLETSPSWQATDYNMDVGCTWGDMDGDGYLDLLVVSHADVVPDLRIYHNNNGTLETIATWKTGVDSIYTANVTTGDIDKNGWQDIAIAKGFFQPYPAWPNYVYMNFDGIIDTIPSWISSDTMWTSDVQFADIDGDDYIELVCAHTDRQAAVYHNNNGILEDYPSWFSNAQGRGSGISLGDIDNDGIIQWVDTLLGNDTLKLFYLAHYPVHNLDSITLNGIKIPVADYCYIRESGWFTLKATPALGDTLRVYYKYSIDMELAQTGTFLYRNTNAGIKESARLTNTVELKARPNPFSHSTRITYKNTTNDIRSVKVYDISGRIIRDLSLSRISHGLETEIIWDGKDNYGHQVAAGVYYFQIKTSDRNIAIAVILIK